MSTENLTDRKSMAKAASDAFWDRFKFILWINDDIVCQRYFRINGYNKEMRHTEEFCRVMDECVNLIKDDLKYKSFILQSYTHDTPIKLTGFCKDPATPEDVLLLTDTSIEGSVRLSDGRVVEKSYFRYPDSVPNTYYNDEEELNPWDVVFKFQFLIDEEVVYERIWDGTQYPKYVRNSVDLTNSNAAYRDKDQSNLYFNTALIKHMTYGRKDLTYHIIKNIVGVLSTKPGMYDKYEAAEVQYGDKHYTLKPNSKDVTNNWRVATNQKTRRHVAQIDKAERYAQFGGLTEGEWNYIEQKL